MVYEQKAPRFFHNAPRFGEKAVRFGDLCEGGHLLFFLAQITRIRTVFFVLCVENRPPVYPSDKSLFLACRFLSFLFLLEATAEIFGRKLWPFYTIFVLLRAKTY